MKINIDVNPSCKETEVRIVCAQKTKEITEICHMLEAKPLKLRAMRNKEIFLVNNQDILYIEAVDKKVFLYTDHAVYESASRLYELLELLQSHDFIRVGKSMIVNFMKVISIQPDLGGRLYLVMENKEICCVSRQYAGQIKERLGAQL